MPGGTATRKQPASPAHGKLDVQETLPLDTINPLRPRKSSVAVKQTDARFERSAAAAAAAVRPSGRSRTVAVSSTAVLTVTANLFKDFANLFKDFAGAASCRLCHGCQLAPGLPSVSKDSWPPSTWCPRNTPSSSPTEVCNAQQEEATQSWPPLGLLGDSTILGS